jgi:hypothetical protein
MQVRVPMCVCMSIHTCIHVCLCAYACACVRVTFPCKTPPLGVLSPMVVMFVWASALFACVCRFSRSMLSSWRGGTLSILSNKNTLRS